MKTSRAQLTKQVATPASFNAFFSFPVKKTGYSGVATYVRTSSVVPIGAEEGLCGLIQPKPPLSSDERVSPNLDAYPQQVIADEAEHGGDPFATEDTEAEELDWKSLDAEGRAIVVDFGLFVLINVYVPNDGVDTKERDKYKMDFHHILEARVKGLIEKEKREVIVLGDLNACSAIIDHCEGHLMVKKGLAEGLQGEEGFWGRAYRRRMKDWLVKEDEAGNTTAGTMVDVVRRFWPDRKGMYTCWNTKISARETNYGTRIDYILITPGLLPWVKSGDIQPQVKGSDHCPVYIDLHESVTAPDGTVTKLNDVLGVRSAQAGAEHSIALEPPRIAAKFWDEFSGKQMMLDKFFGGKSAAKSSTTANPIPTSGNGVEAHASLSSGPPTPTPNLQHVDSTIALPDQEVPATQLLSSTPSDVSLAAPIEISSTMSTKRKLTVDSLVTSSSSKKLKQKASKPDKTVKGQAKLAAFFVKPKTSSPKTSQDTTTESATSTPSGSQVDGVDVHDVGALDDDDADYKLALALASQESQSPPSPSKNTPLTEETKQAWSSLLAPTPPPKCYMHGEPAKEYTVNKQGPNKGKRFFICSRPVGPGYDKGRGQRLREHVDPQWRCDFFKWSSEVRREMRKT